MATNPNVPFLLDRKDVILVKPSIPTPSDVLSLSSIDNDFKLEVFSQAIYVYQASVDYPNGQNPPDPARVIKEALSRVLVHYYPLAGKLKRQSDGSLRINCDANGVPFVEATADCQLSSLRYFEGVDAETGKLFVFDSPTDSDGGYHPLVLQVTQFSCGGFTIGMGLSHSVCDGFGAAQFFQALAELASGKSELSVKPVWERERLVGTPNQDPIQLHLDKTSLATSPHWPATYLVNECFDVRSESISKLKQSLTKETGNDESFTLVEALGAYIWRSRLRALELNPDGKTMFQMAVGIRNRLNPPLPGGYYGNALVSTYVVLTARELDEEPLSKAAKLIKESKKIASNNEYILDALRLYETERRLNIKSESSGAATVLADWRRMNVLEEVDFGWKAAVNILPIPGTFGYADLCTLLPPCSLDATMKGGVRVLVSLPRAATDKFKEEMNALELGDDCAHI